MKFSSYPGGHGVAVMLPFSPHARALRVVSQAVPPNTEYKTDPELVI